MSQEFSCGIQCTKKTAFSCFYFSHSITFCFSLVRSLQGGSKRAIKQSLTIEKENTRETFDVASASNIHGFVIGSLINADEEKKKTQ